MSHFSVLVITNVEPTQKVLEKTLQPWHEYECTGVDDEYVIDVDVTDKLMKEWKKPVSAVRLADGTLLSKYEGQFWSDNPEYKKLSPREQLFSDVQRRLFTLPEGATELEAPQSELGETLEAFADSWGGWFKKDNERFYDHTNPNKKWDWWQVGGRNTGKLSGYDPDKDPANREKCFLCHGTGMRMDDIGQAARAKDPSFTCNGCNGKGWRVSWPTSWKSHDGDKVRVSHLDIDGMKKRNQDGRRKWAQECCDNASVTLEELEIACREEPLAHADWMNLPDPKPRGDKYIDWLKQQGGNREILARAKHKNWELPDVGTKTLDAWVAAAPAVTTYAYVKDGEWHERGEMGWFGASFNEKEAVSWEDEVMKMVLSLQPDQWITVVDCHI